MKDITVEKTELIGKLKANLAQHEEDYCDAYEAWKKAATEYHEQRIIEIRDDLKPASTSEPQKPSNYASSYQQALEMLQMEVRDVVTINENEFRQYVQDQWTFTLHFQDAVSNLTGKMY